VDNKRLKLAELEQRILAPGFWNDPDEARRVQKERGAIQEVVNSWENCAAILEDAELLQEMAEEEGDTDTEREVAVTLAKLDDRVTAFETECLFSGDLDENNALLTIHAGAGGTEAQDWVDILLRMYLRWAEVRGFDADILDILPGDEAGTKSVTILVQGRNAYGFLRSEMGIHRLVRISPFDAGGRRHTSFASVFVIPEVDDSIDVQIDEKELRVDTYRSSGSGGQHVNKTDSAIRITHLPTNIVVQCQNERSQHRNKDTAMKMLKARLYEREKELQAAKQQQDFHDDKKEIAWGSQIRSYVLQPYRLVKDHRTGHEVGNVDSVLDGHLDPFIKSYLLWRHKESLRV